jgi:hypothetical protein
MPNIFRDGWKAIPSSLAGINQPPIASALDFAEFKYDPTLVNIGQ